MTIIVQATTMRGDLVEKARWPVNDLLAVQEGQRILVNFSSRDKNIISYISRQQSSDCMLDTQGNQKGETTVILGFRVQEIRQMIDAKTSKVDSMVIVTPANKVVEAAMMFMLQPEKCDPRFLGMLKERAIRQAGS
jgi:hypothetical protein